MNVTTDVFRNWSAICHEQNDLLRLLISTCKDECVLNGLKVGFPELFQDTPSDVCVPASALREAVRRRDEGTLAEDEDLYAELHWHSLLDDFNIPLAEIWSQSDSIAPQRPPMEIIQQLVGQELRACMEVTYRDVPCYVVGIDWSGPPRSFGSKLTLNDADDPDFMVLVPQKFIDVNA